MESICPRTAHGFRHQLALNPGLAALLEDQDWLAEIWLDVIAQVADEMGVALLPETCPWSSDQVLNAAAGSVF